MDALMFSHLSPKRNSGQIGTFGLGFKAVLGLTDSPEFFSRAGSFRFSRSWARSQVQRILPHAETWPVLSLPQSIDPIASREADPVLDELMTWAVNIVRLPLLDGASEDVRQQIRTFPPEFLLFVPHVRELTLTDGSPDLSRELRLEARDDGYHLNDGPTTGRWKVFERTHELSDAAYSDRRPGDDRKQLPLWWAAPLDGHDKARDYWSYFPTSTPSLVAGILNAPWKTNEDRQYLLPGSYNDDLIRAAARMIAENLPDLQASENPAHHLDALPRRHESKDDRHADLLRTCIFKELRARPIVPDQDGVLRTSRNLRYPPENLPSDGPTRTAVLEMWQAYSNRPRRWLHHSALTPQRLATITRLHHGDGSGKRPWTLPRATIAVWLEALTRAVPDDAVEASKVAIQIATLIPPDIRSPANLGRIVLTASGRWERPDPDRVSLPQESDLDDPCGDPDWTVHPAVALDDETLAALRDLGFRAPSQEIAFRRAADKVFATSGAPPRDSDSERFWAASRGLDPVAAHGVVGEYDNWKSAIRVRSMSGTWKPVNEVLLPGTVVPGDGSRDDAVTVDTDFHEHDKVFLKKIGATSAPVGGLDPSWEEAFLDYRDDCRILYLERYLEMKDAGSTPQVGKLKFHQYAKIGPLGVFAHLSDKGKARYTDALLRLDSCFEQWEMHHGTVLMYPSLPFDSLTVQLLEDFGRVDTPAGVVPLADAFGSRPANLAALLALLQHPQADRIKKAFGLADLRPEFIGEGDRIPLTDIWPGLAAYLSADRKSSRLVPCEQILVAGQDQRCLYHGSDVFLTGSLNDDRREALRLVASAMDLDLADREVDAILQQHTAEETAERRAAIKALSTNAERLLEAVGEETLRDRLPSSLLEALEYDREPLTPVEVAEAAISTYHTDALWHYRQELDALDPPTRWAGSAPATAFVQALGFPDAWAGQRNEPLPPYIKVDGPEKAPELHTYQRTIANNLRAMLRGEHSERRGMISLPTGSGKTLVAVQGIVEAIRDDGFHGTVLWVADRQELCEQAVESWELIWRSKGTRATTLLISRLWGGQEPPHPTSDLHVVVATIQSLRQRLADQPADYAFLDDFRLIVCDEAHRSLAPTYTDVLRRFGITYRGTEEKRHLLGLTATPYKGHDELETARLTNRYSKNRLDLGAFNSDRAEEVIRELQDKGMLAEADHEVIEGGTLEVSDAIADDSLPWLPQAAEDRLASDARRTRSIIHAYRKHIQEGWPTLIFATSVEHARTIAALLNHEGVPARAVDAKTKPVTRRQVVEDFRSGNIKVLVNYGVFREGFDAPKTRAILVAQPVYSPNYYFQMIGRGLRGPKNRGGERCLILNVQDNIQNYNRALAFTELDWLWATGTSSRASL
ncbi:MAG: DEAD/DEAH box helicase [bacterium]|nr:DEAD/DEAH box helicase [bacterium]